MENYIGEIRMVAFNYAPQGWLLCQGQLLSISQYSALFALLGTTYGGNGTTNFALPNLQGRFPIQPGSSGSGGSYVLGQAGGAASTTLTTAQMPSHNHPFTLQAQNAVGTATNPGNAYIAQVPDANSDPVTSFAPSLTSPAALAGGSVGLTGGNQPLPTLPPYLAVNFIIALTGIYPPRP